MLQTFIKILELICGRRPQITKDTTLGELVRPPFEGKDFVAAVLAFQATCKRDIPDSLCVDWTLTVEEFVLEVCKLPVETDDLFVAQTFKIYVDLLGHRSIVQEETIN